MELGARSKHLLTSVVLRNTSMPNVVTRLCCTLWFPGHGTTHCAQPCSTWVSNHPHPGASSFVHAWGVAGVYMCVLPVLNLYKTCNHAIESIWLSTRDTANPMYLQHPIAITQQWPTMWLTGRTCRGNGSHPMACMVHFITTGCSWGEHYNIPGTSLHARSTSHSSTYVGYQLRTVHAHTSYWGATPS